MYNGVNDENNESSFNSDENLYHYSYSKDQAPQPGQPDPSQTSWQPADEPTNDLDITTLGILEDYITKFRGCVIIVSHDRFFLDRTVDHLFVFEGNGVVKDFPGNYSDYREWKTLQKKEEEKPKKEEPKAQRQQRTYANKMTFKERKEFDSLSADIASLEEEKKQIEADLSGASLSVDEITERSRRMQEIIDALDEKEMRWLELSEKEQ